VTSWSDLAEEGARGNYFDLSIDSEDNLYMLNIDDGSVLIKFDTNGVNLMALPQIYCGSDYFSVYNQGGVWVDQQGLIYITNSSSNGICVLDKDGNFVGSFKLEDAQEGQYNEPVDIVGDNAGNIYVLESRNDGYRVQVFEQK
jgi:DNA-binding beta-propeller fold protein YncE